MARSPGPASDPAFYARAEWYDRACDWDPEAELAFLRRVAARHGARAHGRPGRRGEPRRVLEPFCGTGRLLPAWPTAVGFDRCTPMLARAREQRRGTVFRADAARFAVRPSSFDLAFCLNDSFRHLLAEKDARRHLRSVARALRPGAVYVLGLEVTGGGPADTSTDAWTFRTEGRTWRCRVGPVGDADPATRRETIHVRIDPVHDNGPAASGPASACAADAAVVDDLFPMRTYAPRELEDLVDAEGSFEICAVYQDYASPTAVEISEASGSAILVLKKESTFGGETEA